MPFPLPSNHSIEPISKSVSSASSSSVAPPANRSSKSCAIVLTKRRARSVARISCSSGFASSNVVTCAGKTPFTRNRAGPRSVSSGPTTSPTFAANTVSPAASNDKRSTSPRSMSANARPRSSTRVSNVVPATSSAAAARFASSSSK